MNVAKKNHFNPCFWTAYWNRDFYLAATKTRERVDSRNQWVFSLNVKANKILSRRVKNVHCDKHLAVAAITADGIKAFCKRNFPNEYDRICGYVEANPETVYLDFEPILEQLEKLPTYQVLHEIIPKQCIETQQERAFLASFIYIHMLRSHAVINSLVQIFEEGQVPKFELFWIIKHSLADQKFLDAQIIPLYCADWTLFRSDTDSFPLCDSPILFGDSTGFVALSPHLLLRVDLSRRCSGDGTVTSRLVTPEILTEFRARTIGNTFREIISADEQLLKSWQQSPEFQQRHAALRDRKQYNKLVACAARSELWRINAFGYGHRE